MLGALNTPWVSRSGLRRHALRCAATLQAEYSPDLRNVLTPLQSLYNRRVERVFENLPDAFQTVPHPMGSGHRGIEHVLQRFHFVPQQLQIPRAAADLRQVPFEGIDELPRLLQINFAVYFP